MKLNLLSKLIIKQEFIYKFWFILYEHYSLRHIFKKKEKKTDTRKKYSFKNDNLSYLDIDGLIINKCQTI